MKPIVKKYEELQEDWKKEMLETAHNCVSFAKLYTCVCLTRRYHEHLLETEEYRDHFELCKDIVEDKWVELGNKICLSRNAGHGTYSLMMRNMFKWMKEDNPDKPAAKDTQSAVPTSDDDELEKFKTKKTPAPSTELKVINQ